MSILALLCEGNEMYMTVNLIQLEVYMFNSLTQLMKYIYKHNDEYDEDDNV